MNHTQKLMGTLLSAAIHNEKIDELYENIDWHGIFWLSQEHQVQSLIYSVIKDISTDNGGPDRELSDKWKKVSSVSLVDQHRCFNYISEVVGLINQAEIPVIVLKGLVVRELYPSPEMRTMADADLLVDEKNIDLIKDVLISSGYQEVSSSYKDIRFIKEGQYTIEIHTKLTREIFYHKTKDWESSLWNNAVPFCADKMTALSLSYEDNLIYFCLHMINHIISSGFGIRQLCDFTVYFEKYYVSMNWPLFLSKADELGIHDFIATVFSLCKRLLNMKGPDYFKADDEKIEALVSDVFSGGVFGDNKPERIVSGILFEYSSPGRKKHSRLITLLILMFPPYHVLIKKYEFIGRYPFLLPVAWIIRIIKNIFRKDIVFSARTDYFSVFKSQCVYEERHKLLKTLGLL